MLIKSTDSTERKNSFGEVYHNYNGRPSGQKSQHSDEALRQRILAIDPSKIPSRHRAFIRRFQLIAKTSRRDGKKFTLTSKQLVAIEEGAQS